MLNIDLYQTLSSVYTTWRWLGETSLSLLLTLEVNRDISSLCCNGVTIFMFEITSEEIDVLTDELCLKRRWMDIKTESLWSTVLTVMRCLWNVYKICVEDQSLYWQWWQNTYDIQQLLQSYRHPTDICIYLHIVLVLLYHFWGGFRSQTITHTLEEPKLGK